MVNAVPRGNWAAYTAVFLMAAATLTLEIALTRIFSFVLWYHFAFMSISVALLGFGLSGIVAMRSRRVREAALETIVASCGAAFGLSCVLVLSAICWIPLDPAGLGLAWLPTLALVLDFLVLTIPFFFSGLAIITILTRLARDADRVYFMDLLGSGVGCFLILGLIRPLGGEGIVLFAGLLGMLPGILLGCGYSTWSRRALAAGAMGMVVLIWFAAELFPLAPKAGRDVNRNKTLTQWLNPHFHPNSRRTFTGWNAYSRVDVVENAGLVAWLVNVRFMDLPRPRSHIIIDGDAATSIVGFQGNPRELEFLKSIPSALPYEVLRPASALILGAGGGADVYAALVHGAKDVDAVEINPMIVELMEGRYADYSGGLFSRPEVRLHLDEGRSFVSRTHKQYDLIQLSLIDTWAALSSGAYSLSENYLYTVEAFRDYYRRLTPRGALSITRWLWQPPRESLRLCSVGLEALHLEGVETPKRHFLVYGSMGIGTMVMKREPFTTDEVQSFEAEGRRRGFRILYDPFTARSNAFQAFFDTTDRSVFYREYPFDITPVTDDSPFFFLQHRWRDLDFLALFKGTQPLREIPGKLLLLLILAISLLFSAILLLLPLARGSRYERRGGESLLLCYFFGVGIGFMVVEILLMQKFSLFLGHPVHAISLVLFSLLVFSGFGSLASRRLVRDSPRRLGWTVALLGILVATSFALYPAIFSVFLGAPFPVRVAVALGAMFPMCFLMGVPFPAAIRWVSDRRPQIIPWAWAVNAFASVASSSLCVLLAMEIGFSAAAALAGICYLAASAVFLLPGRGPAAGALRSSPEPPADTGPRPGNNTGPADVEAWERSTIAVPLECDGRCL